MRRVPRSSHRPPAATRRGLAATLALPAVIAVLSAGAWTAYRAAAPEPAHDHAGHDHAAPDAGAPVAAPEQRKLLVLRTYFANYEAESRYDATEVAAHMASMNDLWRQTSYDHAELDVSISPLFQVPGDDTDYVDWDESRSSGAQFIQMVEDAVAAAPEGTDFEGLDGILVVMAETDPDNWHRGRAGKLTLPLGEDGADVEIKCAIVLENPSDADDKVWGRWMHEVGHVFQVAGPSHPSSYDSAYEIMDGHYPGQTGVFSKLATQGFPGWLPGWKYVAFTPDPTVGPAGAGLGGGLASVWATEYDPADKPNPQAVQAFITDSAYYLVSMRRRVLGDDINSSFSPPGIPDEGVLIERVVEGGDPDAENRWVTLQPPPGGDINDLWQCGQTYVDEADGIEIAIGRKVVREVVLGAAADAWIREGDAANHGGDDTLHVGNFQNPEGGFDGRFRSLVRFDLSAVPAGATIETATLRLRHQDVSGSQVVPVILRRANAAWDEHAVTWANQPGSDFMQLASVPVGPDAGPIEWDVTNTVASWLGGVANHGFLVRAVEESANAIPRRFHSREHLGLGLGGASAFKPTLTVVFSETCPPEDDDPDQAYVRVSYDPGATQPDVHVSPWRTAPLDAWESTDLWIDSPVNGFGTYRAGTWTTPWGDSVPYWNGDEPTVGATNRVVARVRNVGTQNATNVVVHFDITDPPGLGISGADGFKALGSVDAGDFPALGLIAPGGYADVWVPYEPDIALDEQAIEDGFFAFHTCLRVRVDPVAGETIVGNQDGEEEQENVFWYEAPAGDEGAEPPKPFSGSIHVRNGDPLAEREHVLYAERDLPAGWEAVVHGGEQVLVLGPGESADVPVVLEPPEVLPAIGSAARVDVAASYLRVLTNALFTGHDHEHDEQADLGGVTVVGGVVADTDTACTAQRVAGGIAVSGIVSAALGEPLRGASVYVRADGSPHTALAAVASDGTFSAVIEDPAGTADHVDCLFGGTKRLGRSADAAVPVPPPAGGGRPTPTAPEALVVGFAPERAVIAPSGVYSTAVYLPAPPDAALERVALTVSFDPAVVRVADADPRAPGVQAMPGSALAGYRIATNAADNRAGRLVLEAERGGARGAPGRELLVVGFEAVAVGRSALRLAEVRLADAAGDLATAPKAGSIEVTADAGRVAFRVGGHVKVFDGATGAHGGTRVCGPGGCALTGADGAYELPGVRVGDGLWTERAGFLTRRWTIDAPPREAGGLLASPEIVIRPGDVDGDGIVGLADGVGVLGAVGAGRQDGRYLVARDLDRDDAIGAKDVALLAAQWGMAADPEAKGAATGGRAPAGTAFARLPRRTGRTLAGWRAGEGLAQDGPHVSVVPARASVLAGERVTVEVRAEGVAGLYGASFVLRFDPSILAVVDAEPATRDVQVWPGDLLPAGDRTVLHNAASAEAGEVGFAAGLTGAVRGVSGGGVLARVVLRALAPGGTDLRLAEVELRDDAYPDSAVIPATVSHGTVDVRPMAPAEPTAAMTAEPTAAITAEPTAAATAGPGTPSAQPPATTTPEAPGPTDDPPASPEATATRGASGGARRVWLPWALRGR